MLTKYPANTANARAQLKHTAVREPASPPPSEKAIDEALNLQSPSTEYTPPEFKERKPEWFKPGRLFKIFSPSASELHRKEFVLLDSMNKDGQCLLMDSHIDDQDGSHGYFLRSHVLVQDFLHPDHRDSSSKCKIVYLDEYEDQSTANNAWIELEYPYNIAFAKYKYADCGILDPGSLQALRQYYLDWLRYHWQLG